MKNNPRIHQRPGLRRAALLLFVTALACAVSADAPRIESVWATEAPTVDGVLKEWASLSSLDPAKVSAGVRNDGRVVYVALTASDQSTRMLLGAAGFTVWFDPAGKHKKAFGITIPPTMARGPGMRGRGPGGPRGGEGQEGPPPGQTGPPPEGGRDLGGQEGQRPPEAGGPPDRPGFGVLEPIRHIEVAGPGKDDRRRLELAYARTIGIDVAAKMAEGVLVYEIGVPLAASADQPHAERSVPGAVIGLGIETGEIERPAGRGDSGGRGRGGGRGGGPGGIGGPGGGPGGIGGGGMGGRMRGGGMGGGMMGGGPGGGRGGMDDLKPIKVWTVVRLANPPA